MSNPNTLYITFDGLTDPLGQSQILPYLTGVSKNGYNITIISCEKKKRFEKDRARIESLISNLPIDWKYIMYDEDGGFLSRFSYIRQIKKLAFSLHKDKNFQLIHCRSYLAALTGLQFKLKKQVPFLFDMRGLWADERIDGGIWTKTKLHHRLFYNYFKKKEKQFFKNSDAVVSLTHSGVKELSRLYGKDLIAKKTTVIPCCTNTELFNLNHNVGSENIELNGISDTDEVLVYSGSIGTWYYTKEMIDCVLTWQKQNPKLKLLIITKDNEALDQVLKNYSPAEQKIVVKASASYNEMPKYLSRAKAAIFFIKPAYSKIASSPTKMAECWSMNLPIITNSGIGDNDLYFNEYHGGILLKTFDQSAYNKAFEDYQDLLKRNINFREIALRDFDTTMAVKKYTAIYRSLT